MSVNDLSCFEFNCYKNGKDCQICSPGYKQTPGMLWDQILSRGIVMVMMVRVRGEVCQRLTATPAPPAPPSPSWVLSCLSCSAVFLELYFMFSEFVIPKCVSAWVSKQALTLFKTCVVLGCVGYYCYACVFYMCTFCTLRCAVCLCVGNFGDMMLISQELSYWFLWCAFHSPLTFICGLRCMRMLLFVSHSKLTRY